MWAGTAAASAAQNSISSSHSTAGGSFPFPLPMCSKPPRLLFSDYRGDIINMRATAAAEVVCLLVELGADAARDEPAGDEEPLLWCVCKSQLSAHACMSKQQHCWQHA